MLPKARAVQVYSAFKSFSRPSLIATKSARKQSEVPSTTINQTRKKHAVCVAKLVDPYLDGKLPEPPYPGVDYFALNTYRSSSKTLPPAKLCRAIVTFLRNSALVDLCLKKIRDWQLQYEFFHRDRKIEFCISFFEDNFAPTKESCLIEMHRISGEHEPFHRLAEILRQRHDLVYAFGFMAETDEEPPKSLQTFDFFLDGQAPPAFEPCSAQLGAVLKHVESPYADVQTHAWHTLSQITAAKTVAESLLKSKIHGRDAFQEIKSCAETSTSSHDDHRLISKTMNNLMNVLNTNQVKGPTAVLKE